MLQVIQPFHTVICAPMADSMSDQPFPAGQQLGLAMSEEPNIFDQTIRIAATHGIALRPDVPNSANGDCLFDSIIDNINHRPVFQQSLGDSVQAYRELWVTELEEQFKLTEIFPGYGDQNVSDETLGEWTAAWTEQKNPGQYNVDKFNVSDLTPLGLGHCTKKNILVFSNDPQKPIQVFASNFFNKANKPTTEVPVMIAYDSQHMHYESLLPLTEDAASGSIKLVKKILKAEYDRKRRANVSDHDQALDAKRKKMARDAESAEARNARNAKDRSSKAENRSAESAEARDARKAKDKSSKADKRSAAESIVGHKGYPNCAKQGEIDGKIDPINLGQMTAKCDACHAYMFPWESHKISKDGKTTFSLCCSHGAVKIPSEPEFPPLLQQLLTGTDPISKEFYRNIRGYNNALSLASRGFSGKQFVFRTRGPPIFKVSGQAYHCMGNVLPNNGQIPQFSQQYVFDEQHELDNRMTNVPGLDRQTLAKLQDVMHKDNELVKLYKTATQRMKENPAVDVQMVLKARTNENSKKMVKYPTTKDVAIIIPNRADNDRKNPRDVVLHKNQESNPTGTRTVRISSLHKAYDPTAYPILFPTGNYGFDLECPNTDSGKKVNTLKFYQYKLMERLPDPRKATIHNCGRLFQEYLCDMYSKIEEERLAYHERNQSQLRTESLDGLADAIASSDHNDAIIGKEVKLPGSFVLSQRWMFAHYLDALAIARKYKRFSWFVTMTCNPQMAEHLERIQAMGQSPSDRPDLLDRLFNKHMKLFIEDLTKNDIMGKAIAWVIVFERQMRALWHAHISLLTEGVVPESEIDDWVLAQIPDYNPDDPDHNSNLKEYYELVAQHMLHGPCGDKYPNAPCMVPNKDGKKACRAGYPKLYNEKTHLQANGYPHYARPDNGRFIMKNGVKYTNRDVVPHNPYILVKYKSHCNVEYTASLSTVRYQFKYMSKGNDLASVQMVAKEDASAKNEIEWFVNSRYIDPHLAVWRMFEYKIQERFPAVMRLDIHDDGKQFVYFRPGEEAEKVDKPKVTTLKAWFEYNKEGYLSYEEDEPKNFDYTYMEFPEHYSFNGKTWKPRKRETNFVTCIGRVHAVPRSSDDRYYLRMLLHHVKGATDFSDLKTVDGTVHETYKAAASALGLLSDDNEIVYAMNETYDFGNPHKLRNLFAILLNYGEISDPRAIFDEFIEKMIEDNWEVDNLADRHNKCVVQLDDLLQDMGSSLAQFPDLPQPNHDLDLISETRAFRRERYNEVEQADKLDGYHAKLQNNAQQMDIFQQVVQAVDNDQNKQFVINAPAGYGKTFLFECMSTYVRSKGDIALCCASTGIAAWNMEGGRTAHSLFKIPINADEDSTSDIRSQTSEAAVIRAAKLIIWDEIFNVHQFNIRVVDRLLKDVMQNKLPFGGKVVVFGGDPRQTPPVVTKGKRGETVAASFKSCPLYNEVTELHLSKNMRVKDGDEEFCQWLLDIGNGTINDATQKNASDDQFVRIPDRHLVKSKMDLIEATFPKLEDMSQDDLMSSGIFCPRNDDSFEINQICLKKLPGESKTYLSYDRVEDEEDCTAQTELLNSRRPNGFPDHNLVLKVGAPIMLLRNLQCGLVNGTRLAVKAMHSRVLECEVMVGNRKGEIVFIPRIPIYDRSNEFPWTMIRVQFPVRVCFAMTIHKGQGQSMTRVGVYIPRPMFAHGQLYVGLSRAVLALGLKVFIDAAKKSEKTNLVKNVVYKEIL